MQSRDNGEIMPTIVTALTSRHALGAWGEKYATRRLRKLATIRRAIVHYRKYAGDIKATTIAGDILRVEVKTATKGVDGNYHATLKKSGHTDCINTQFVILLCVVDTSLVIPYVIPTLALGNRRAIAITGNPATYSGQWGEYRNAWELIA